MGWDGKAGLRYLIGEDWAFAARTGDDLEVDEVDVHWV